MAAPKTPSAIAVRSKSFITPTLFKWIALIRYCLAPLVFIHVSRAREYDWDV
jgi:hypothetical protein